MAYADQDKRRRLDRERHRRRAAERTARGLCPRCGTRPMAPERRLCTECIERKRAAERARYAAGKTAGKLYGGRRVAALAFAGLGSDDVEIVADASITTTLMSW